VNRSLPYIESVRQLKWELVIPGLFSNTSYFGSISHSTGGLRQNPHNIRKGTSRSGYQPDILILRTEISLNPKSGERWHFLHVWENAVVESVDVPDNI
jgi:CTP synthase